LPKGVIVLLKGKRMESELQGGESLLLCGGEEIYMKMERREGIELTIVVDIPSR